MVIAKRVTMKDIARAAGVSRPAVSAALSSKASTIALGPETRRRIKALAEQMGYQRNILARSFIEQKSYLVGFISREEHFVYALATTKGIEEVLENLDYSLLIFYGGNTPAEQTRHLKRSMARKVDGLIVSTAPEPPGGPNRDEIWKARETGLPVVQVYRKIIPDIPVVMTDDRTIGKLATQHLIGLGHRRIAHFTHDQYTDEATYGQNLDALQRYQGYEQAMRDAGLEPIVVTYPAATYGGLGYSRGARQYAERLANHPARFTAATTFADFVAVGLLKGLQDLKLRVPDDISIVGYDDIEAATVVDPPLTTLRQQSRQIGREAVRMVLDMMADKAVSDVILEPELVVRASTAPPK